MTREDFIVWRRAILLVLAHYAKKFGLSEKETPQAPPTEQSNTK
jgi:hypothetical protein